MNTNRITRPTIPGRQRGFTLVELMVAMAISAALMVGIVQVFMSSKATYRVVDNLSRIQENGRFAMDSVSFDVRMAGYRGCRSISTTEFDNSLNGGDTNALYDFEVGIRGFDAVNSGFSDGYLRDALDDAIDKALDDDNVKIELIPSNSGSHNAPDAVIVRAVFSTPMRLGDHNVNKEDSPTGATRKAVEQTSLVPNACPDGSAMRGGICVGDIVMISDCNKARVFQVTSISNNLPGNNSAALIAITHAASGDPGNKSPPGWGGYSAGSEIVKVGTRIYFIANYVDRDNNRIPSLFVLDEYGRAEMLAANVEDMQIVYGVDTNPSEYMLRSDALGLRKTANEIESDSSLEWEHVVNAEIRLLMRSEDQFLTPDGQPQNYIFNQTSFTPPNGDTRLRREFASTITVRNRALF